MLEYVDRALEWTGSISQWIFEDRQDQSNSWPYLLVARLPWISTFPLVQRRYDNICVIGLWRISEEDGMAGEDPLEMVWQPVPVFLPGEFHGQRNLARCSPQGCKESDTTE